MNGSFYHDTVDDPQKIKGHFVVAEKDSIATTSDFDEIGTIVLYNDELYVYTSALEYKKITVAA